MRKQPLIPQLGCMQSEVATKGLLDRMQYFDGAVFYSMASH